VPKKSSNKQIHKIGSVIIFKNRLRWILREVRKSWPAGITYYLYESQRKYNGKFLRYTNKIYFINPEKWACTYLKAQKNKQFYPNMQLWSGVDR
jgi:hypothetical protein